MACEMQQGARERGEGRGRGEGGGGAYGRGWELGAGSWEHWERLCKRGKPASDQARLGPLYIAPMPPILPYSRSAPRAAPWHLFCVAPSALRCCDCDSTCPALKTPVQIPRSTPGNQHLP
jgi:hypothetical protein